MQIRATDTGPGREGAIVIETGKKNHRRYRACGSELPEKPAGETPGRVLR